MHEVLTWEYDNTALFGCCAQCTVKGFGYTKCLSFVAVIGVRKLSDKSTTKSPNNDGHRTQRPQGT